MKPSRFCIPWVFDEIPEDAEGADDTEEDGDDPGALPDAHAPRTAGTRTAEKTTILLIDTRIWGRPIIPSWRA
jgi:hypothetical protein